MVMPARVEQHACPALPAIDLRPDLVQVYGDGADHGAPDRHETFLATLAEDANEILREQQVRDAEAAELRDAHARAVPQLQQRAIPPGERLVDARGGEQRLDLGHRERIGEDPSAAG